MTAVTATTDATEPGGGRVPPAIGRAQALVRPALEEAVARLSTGLRLPVEYHLGWCDPNGAPTGAPGGKFVRATLALLSAEAAGAPAEVGLPGAVAVELLHNFSLLHDDVIDHDVERRHRPTVWAVYGVGTAVIAGDALLALSHQTLLELPGPGPRAASRALAFATSALIAGEAEDMASETRTDITPDECTAIALGKTAVLLACASSIGVPLAEGDPRLAETLGDFGLNVGLAFQAVDDVLGIWGDPQVTGKPAGSDLRDRKKTLPIVAAMHAGGSASEELQELLELEALDEAQVARAASLVEACGGRDRAESEARRFLEAALEALTSAEVPGPVDAELRAVARFVVDRDA